jgi:hypothetical protein
MNHASARWFVGAVRYDDERDGRVHQLSSAQGGFRVRSAVASNHSRHGLSNRHKRVRFVIPGTWTNSVEANRIGEAKFKLRLPAHEVQAMASFAQKKSAPNFLGALACLG